jgi:hypothetical protein
MIAVVLEDYFQGFDVGKVKEVFLHFPHHAQNILHDFSPLTP